MTDATESRPEQAPASPSPEALATPSARAKAPPPRGSRRSPLAALALVLSVAALAGGGAGGWLLWQRLQDLQAQQAQLATGAELQRGLAEARGAREEQQLRIAALAQDTGRNAEQAQRLQQQLSELVSLQRALDERLTRLDAQARASQSEWMHAEASYLAKTAVIRLRFHRDVDGAIAALRLADELLARAGAEAAPARQAVNKGIEQLVTVQVPDIRVLAGRIDDLVGKVDILPLEHQLYDSDLEQSAQASAEPAAAEGGWRARLQRAWDRIAESLGKLVVVQRDKAVEPLLAPEERYFLYHNLRLRLETAKLALLQGDPVSYRRSLSRATEWIERYYALGEPPVEAALAELTELRKVDIQPALPDLGEVLAPVARY